MSASNTSAQRQKVIISVVLEYQWTSTRDLIEFVEVEQVSEASSGSATRMTTPQNYKQEEETKEQDFLGSDMANINTQEAEEQEMKVIHEVPLKSVIQGLENVGFDLEPDHRVSFHHPEKKLYVYIGKVCDKVTMDRFMLPKTAFSDYGKSSQLTLMVRESGTGSSAQKQQDSQVASALTEQLRKNLFAQSFPEPKELKEVAEQGLSNTVKYAQQTHALLNSQSFNVAGLSSDIEGNKQLHRSHSNMNEQQKEQNLSHNKKYAEKPAADEYCITENKRTKERQIRYVVERVSLWRKLYNGVDLGNGETVRYSLEDSARLVGISKKSLDDYLLQLRFGRMYGFDFLKHQCDNIGQLRKFVREHKNKQKKQSQKSESGKTSIHISFKAPRESVTPDAMMGNGESQDRMEENKFDEQIEKDEYDDVRIDLSE